MVYAESEKRYAGGRLNILNEGSGNGVEGEGESMIEAK